MIKSLDWSAQAARLETDVAAALFEGIDTPVSLSCYILLKAGCNEQLVRKTVDPLDYLDSKSFDLDYQAVSLLSKSMSVKTDIDLEQVAYDKYMASEARCKETNDRFYLGQNSDSNYNPLILRVREIIREILGRIPKDIDNFGDFGPGATTDISGIVTLGRKYQSTTLSLTEEMLTYALFHLPKSWRRNVSEITIRNEGKLTFVPKNAKTHRAIEIQPSLNIWFQKSIGSYIRRRLALFGVCLNDQTRNQQLALEGSITNQLCTVDLSSASDNIAFYLVKTLLPKSWFELLCFCRVGRVKYRDEVVELEKFSAMGNGYTFELQSLIFYAVTRALGSTRSNVYGDDIIIESHLYDQLLPTLEFLGFRVNTEKTFGTGPFRESCGADFFMGINVRPIFLKQKVRTRDDYIEYAQNTANSIVRKAISFSDGWFRDIRFFRAWSLLVNSVPIRHRRPVPLDQPAGGFVSSFDEARPSIRRRGEGWQGYQFRYDFRPPRTTKKYPLGSYVSALNSGSSFRRGEESLRSKKLGTTTRTGYALAWPDFGPWI